MTKCRRVFWNKIINIFPFIFFALFIYLISYRLIGGVIGSSDFPYFWPNSSIDAFSTWNTSYLGYNRASAMFGLQFFTALIQFFVWLGLSDVATSFINNYGIVYICSLVYYFITKNLSQNTYLAYAMGLFIVLNNFVLEHFLVFPGVVFYALTGYGLTFYILYQIYKKGITTSKLICIILLSFLQLHPFYVVINLLLIGSFFVWYITIDFNLKNSLRKSLLGGVVCIGIIMGQAYWLAPFIYNIVFSTSAAVYGVDNQIAVFSGYLQSISYINLFNLYHYPGTLGVKLHGSFLQYFFYSLTLSIVLIGFIRNKTGNTKWLVYLFSMLIITFILALGPKSTITGDIWLYFYNNVSVFGFFRSFSRFIILYLVIFIFIIIFISVKFKNSIVKNTIIVSWGILLIISHSVFFSGDLGGFITSAKVPKEYIEINKKYFLLDNDQYNILTLPNVPYESYTWFSVDKLSKSGDNLRQSLYFREMFFSKPVVYNRYAINLDKKNNFFDKFYSYEEIESDYRDFNQSLNDQNIKYIVVQKDMTDLIDGNKLIDTKKTIEYLDNNTQLMQKENNQSFVLYENPSFYPIIQGQNTIFKKVSDSQYTVQISNINKKQPLDFLQSYDVNWTTRIQQVDKNKPTIYTGKYLDSENIMTRGYANQWTIDPEYIKANFDKSMYKENPDGSIDVELTLYFKPQSYFYLGIIISGTTLILCLGYLGYYWVRKRRKSISSSVTVGATSPKGGQNTPPRQAKPATPQFISRRERGE
jgi:hypothetical protein